MNQLANPPSPVDPIERLLDAALEQTFPASDPIAVDVSRLAANERGYTCNSPLER